MDEQHVTPFIDSFTTVMPQLGFTDIHKGNQTLKDQEIICSGVLILIGIVGMMKGNVVFCLDKEHAKQIASTMMMGMEVEELDELSTSALSELANMLAANAATLFSDIGIAIDISTPTLLSGENISVKMSSKQVLCIQLFSDGIPMDVNLAFTN